MDSPPDPDPTPRHHRPHRCHLCRLWSQVGRRGSALLLIGFLDCLYGISLWSPVPQVTCAPGTRYVGAVLPLTVWGCCWLAAGLNCLANAFRRSDRIGWAGAVFIKVLWGALFLFGQLINGWPQGWVFAVIWLCLAAFVFLMSTWPERSAVRPQQDPA